MRHFTLTIFLLACIAGPLAGRAAAQVVPFFNANASLFDPEIGVVNTGIVNDVQAVVSPDKKYVTLNMGASQSNLLALREFATDRGQVLPSGFAGEMVLAAPASGATTAVTTPLPTRRTSGSILQQEGMVVVGKVLPTDRRSPFTPSPTR